MAENRGGYRSPRDKTPRVPAPGKQSRRTDNQPIRVANVQDSEDLQQGDRQRLEQAQRLAPLRRSPAPRVAAPAAGSPAGGGATLPEHVFAGDTSRPNEPLTAGLAFGAGPGAEAISPPPPETDQEVVLQFLADTFQDDAASKMLNEIRNARAVPDEPMEQPALASAAPIEPMEPEPMEMDLPEAEESVEPEGGAESQSSLISGPGSL